jgi:hypothetical protein
MNEDGRPLDPNNTRKRFFEKLLEKGGLRQVRFHDLRQNAESRKMPSNAPSVCPSE